MKVDWSENPVHRQALLDALKFEDLGSDAHHLSVVDSQGRLLYVMGYHNFAESNCEICVANFGIQSLIPPTIVATLLAYPFYQLNLRRLTAIVRADNHRSLEHTRRMGFRVEGLLRNWYSDCHGILHGLLREESLWAARQNRLKHLIR